MSLIQISLLMVICDFGSNQFLNDFDFPLTLTIVKKNHLKHLLPCVTYMLRNSFQSV